MDFARLAAYLGALAENNEKEWFEAHRAEYQALRDDFTAFVGDVIGEISAWDESVRWTDPKDCIFRIHRDVRFSSDKSPYKTTFSAFVSERGRRIDGPGYYFHVDEKGTLFAAGGVYMPPAEPLGRIREHIFEHPETLQAVLRKRDFKRVFGELEGERLKRPPRGYPADAPMMEALKLKSFIVSRERDVRAESSDVFVWITETFRTMYPFLRWLRNTQVG